MNYGDSVNGSTQNNGTECNNVESFRLLRKPHGEATQSLGEKMNSPRQNMLIIL